ncbi:glycoside hydrolase family 81 protein [Jaapia argillacea MUCL 33604]|uniref:glucan endo-1,3-beta-D-glucosidase n=1 Tax=Jaapia argillacea MUCL 33604 TaxID=933084 RepID=A0A067Q0R0_9AGAM|nr:glycoside hydrolase family 81 protein [Jaapia argillacea MUCL 33604]
MASVDDLFLPIATTAPPQKFAVHPNHPVQRKSIVPNPFPIPTNKFYANLFLGNQSQGVWLHPYSVWWSKGDAGTLKSWGLTVSHTDPDQRVYGPHPSQNPVQYYYNPVRIQSFTFSATEFTPNQSFISLDNLGQFSATLKLHCQSNSPNRSITFPLVQGSGFITGIYSDLTPRFDSAVFFRSVKQLASPRPGVLKWQLILEDGKTWLLYAHPASGRNLQLRLSTNSRLEATARFTGVVQVTKVPRESSDFEFLADGATGAWPSSTSLSASQSGSTGTYVFDFDRAGSSPSPLLMYALPHHIHSFDPQTTSHIRYKVRIQSTTKGEMTAVLSDRWVMSEPTLPVDISFSPSQSGIWNLDDRTRSVIYGVAKLEVQQDPSQQSDLDSMYFSGKAIDKFATLCCAVWYSLKDREMTSDLLAKVKEAFARFADNQQKLPLVYDDAWKGIISSGLNRNGDLMSDFGNGCYNDHHFHYGYFVHAAAVIAHIDNELGFGSQWLERNREYVDLLLRDAANPSSHDPYFPVSRAFDWFHGHSWAKGLFESADGKDQESTSEDAYFSYAMTLWGSVTGDKATESRGRLMLAIQRRVFQSYFLMEEQNYHQPANFVKNKVTGILFENKCDHATYFGLETRYIQGIHMIPVSPISPYIRSCIFVKEEWDRFFSRGRVDQFDDGWKGILYSNYAILDPKAAWGFFSRTDFKSQWLDGGATRTWYLVLAAGQYLIGLLFRFVE